MKGKKAIWISALSGGAIVVVCSGISQLTAGSVMPGLALGAVLAAIVGSVVMVCRALNKRVDPER